MAQVTVYVLDSKKTELTPSHDDMMADKTSLGMKYIHPNKGQKWMLSDKRSRMFWL